jgi:hypothetical protein
VARPLFVIYRAALNARRACPSCRLVVGVNICQCRSCDIVGSSVWMLMHILSPTNPPELRTWIMDEIKSAQREYGLIDVTLLSKLPLLNSTFHEVLRVYIDLLIVRQVDAETTIGPHIVNKNEMIMAPSWLSHRNPEHFAKPTLSIPRDSLSTIMRLVRWNSAPLA